VKLFKFITVIVLQTFINYFAILFICLFDIVLGYGNVNMSSILKIDIRWCIEELFNRFACCQLIHFKNFKGQGYE